MFISGVKVNSVESRFTRKEVYVFCICHEDVMFIGGVKVNFVGSRFTLNSVSVFFVFIKM